MATAFAFSELARAIDCGKTINVITRGGKAIRFKRGVGGGIMQTEFWFNNVFSWRMVPCLFMLTFILMVIIYLRIYRSRLSHIIFMNYLANSGSQVYYFLLIEIRLKKLRKLPNSNFLINIYKKRNIEKYQCHDMESKLSIKILSNFCKIIKNLFTAKIQENKILSELS